jgi:hypothetical protein
VHGLEGVILNSLEHDHAFGMPSRRTAGSVTGAGRAEAKRANRHDKTLGELVSLSRELHRQLMQSSRSPRAQNPGWAAVQNDAGVVADDGAGGESVSLHLAKTDPCRR